MFPSSNGRGSAAAEAAADSLSMLGTLSSMHALSMLNAMIVLRLWQSMLIERHRRTAVGCQHQPSFIGGI